MSERGVFAVDRGIFDHPTLSGEKYTKVQAFMWIVAEAAWKPHRRAVGATVVDLKRGQAACSLRFMAGKWGWEEPRVRRFLARLKSDAMIDAASDAGVTVITVCNYDVYQRVSLPSDALADALSDAATTQQRRKVEDRETTEETSLRSVPTKPTKVKTKPKTAIEESTQPTERMLQDARDEGMEMDEIRVEWRGFRDNHLKHDNKFSDWPAAWRTWIRSDYRKERSIRRARGSPTVPMRGNGLSHLAERKAQGDASVYRDPYASYDRPRPIDDGRTGHGSREETHPDDAGSDPPGRGGLLLDFGRARAFTG